MMSNSVPGVQHGALYKKPLDFRRVFPAALLLSGLFLFVTPVVKVADVAFDVTMAYWTGQAPQLVAVATLPLLLLAVGLSWLANGPSRSAVLLGIGVPALMLAVVSERVMGGAVSYSISLTSSDCRSLGAKFELERAWQAAESFASTCQSEVIEECPGYGSAAHAFPTWEYLAEVERRHSCSGWCQPGRSLWGGRAAHGDSCSVAVGETIGTKVVHNMTQVFVHSLVVLALLSTLLVALTRGRSG